MSVSSSGSSRSRGSEGSGLVADDADRVPAETREAAHDVLGPVRVHLEKIAVVDHALDHTLDVVRQGFPVGKHGHPQLRREERQLVGQAWGVGGLRGHDGKQAMLGHTCLSQSRKQERVGRAGGTRQRVALAGRDRGQLHGKGGF